MRKIIYLDNAAATRVSDRVVKEMIPYFTSKYGNSSSIHALGQEARKAVENAKLVLAKKINCSSQKIEFFAKGLEIISHILLGRAKAHTRKKILTSKIEHSSLYRITDELKNNGYQIVEIAVDKNGLVDIEQLKKEIDENTLLVSIAHVNSELGVIQDIEKIGKISHEKGVLFHTDALQSYGKLNIDVEKMNIDFLSAAAHKIGGPKGIAFAYIRNKDDLKLIIEGGENVPGAVGFACALEEKHNYDKVRKIRDYFVKEIEKLGGKWNGSQEQTIFCHANISFSGYNGQAMVSYLSEKGIMCSTGSACDSKKDEKRVLKAIGLTEEEIVGTVRFTFSEEISKKDVDFVIKQIESFMKVYSHLRA